MSYFDVVLETLQGIQKELKATRHAILHQTKLMEESKETPKEAAVSEQEETRWPVTTGEAKQALRLFSENTDNDYEKLIMTWAADRLEKEAAPAPKAITWQAAVQYLHKYCRSVTAAECNDGVCPMAGFCEANFKSKHTVMPCHWEVPANE